MPGAFHRDDIGDIDLVWGNKHYGLKHIEKQRNKKEKEVKLKTERTRKPDENPRKSVLQ